MKEVVDPSDIVVDALAIYKNPSFDERRPLKNSFQGQPAIETGVLRREFYYKVFEKIAGSECSRFYRLFEGPANRLVPVYDAIINDFSCNCAV